MVNYLFKVVLTLVDTSVRAQLLIPGKAKVKSKATR